MCYFVSTWLKVLHKHKHTYITTHDCAPPIACTTLSARYSIARAAETLTIRNSNVLSTHAALL